MGNRWPWGLDSHLSQPRPPPTGQPTFDCHVGHCAHPAPHLAQVDAIVVCLQPVDDEAPDGTLLDLLVLAAGQQALVLTEPGRGDAGVGHFTLQHDNAMLPALHILQGPGEAQAGLCGEGRDRRRFWREPDQGKDSLHYQLPEPESAPAVFLPWPASIPESQKIHQKRSPAAQILT